MVRPAAEHPTELELQILQILWNQSPLTVRQVRDALAEQGRSIAHTAVITPMGTMVEKEQVVKLEPETGKAFRFSPLRGRDEVANGMLGDIVSRVFGGSAEAAMLSLFDVADVDTDEISRLRKLLNKKLRESK